MLNVPIKKADKKQQIVFAEVYAPMRADSDGEFMDAEGVRKMAYNFMQKQRLDQIDYMHTNKLLKGAHVVESFIARKGDDTFIENAWVVGVYIPDPDDWDKVEKGVWNGFSVEAFIKRELTDIEMEIPPVISGKTYKSEDNTHEHTFYVTYDDRGRFLGGVTDKVNGHIHKILRGTRTEDADDHSHRFSHVENLSLSEV